jgi:hypothetical protein
VRDATCGVMKSFVIVRMAFNKIWLASPPLAIPKEFWFA